MNLAQMGLPDLIGTLVGFILTLMVFSYIIGDNPLFRFAIHVFIGVASGFAVVITWYNILWPQLIRPVISGSRSERLFLIIPLILGAFLLLKSSRRLSSWGTWVVAFLIGIAMATAVGGTILGTLFPQMSANINLFDAASTPAESNQWIVLAEGLLVLIGSVTTLIYFQFGARPRQNQPPKRPAWIEGLAGVGQVFISIALGALFAGVYAAALTALVERLQFLVAFILPLVIPQ